MAPPYNATAAGTTTFGDTGPSGFGTCLTLAAAGRLNVPTGPLDFSPDQAWEVQIRFKTSTSALQVIWGTGAGGGQLYCYMSSGKISFALSGSNFVQSTGTFNDGAWHEAAVSFTGTYGLTGTSYPTFYIYVDGILRASLQQRGWTPPTVGSFGIGNLGNSATSFGWTGSLAEMRVFWAALHTGGVLNGAAVYTPETAPGSDSAASQVAHWQLNDVVSSSSAADTNTTVVPPQIRTAISVATSAGTDTITYPAAVAGSNAVSGYDLLGASTKGGEVLLSSNAGAGASTFTHAQAAAGTVEWYVVRAKDATPNYSPLTNEVAAPGNGTKVATNAASIFSSVTACAYSPWNWNVTSAAATTPNPGAYVRFDFTGTSAAITCAYTVHNGFMARVDGQAWVLFQPDLYVQLFTGLTNRRHTLEIIYRYLDNGFDLWTAPQTGSGFQITGFYFDASSTISLPTKRKYNVLVLGDSITCGFGAHGSYASPNFSNTDASVAFSFLMREGLDCDVGVVGFGSQGVSVNVPATNVPSMTGTTGDASGTIVAASSYNKVYSGVTRLFDGSAAHMPVPDLVIYAQGFNDADQGATPATSNAVTQGLANIINAILAIAPASKHLVVSPLTYTGKNAPAASLVPGVVNNPNCTYLDVHSSMGGSTDLADGVHPYDYIHLSVLAPTICNAAVTSLFPAAAPRIGSALVRGVAA